MEQTNSYLTKTSNSFNAEDFESYFDDQMNDFSNKFYEASDLYETNLREFIKRNITGEFNFNFFYEKASESLGDCYDDLRYFNHELYILDLMVYHYVCYLEDQEF